MRLTYATLTALLVSLIAPFGAAGALGQLDSDAPVGLYGKAFAGGSDLELFHRAFEPASLQGILYSGSIIDFETHSSDPRCGATPPREESRTIASVSSSSPDPISFELEIDSVAIVDFGDERLAPAGDGAATDFERDDAQPAAFVGPNPYAIGQPRESFDPGPEYGRILPSQPFLVIPAGTLELPFAGVVHIEFGNLTIVQGGQERTLSAEPRVQTATCSPAPGITLPPEERTVYHRIEIRAGTAVLTIKQGPLEPTLRFYDGEKPARTMGPSGSWPSDVCDAGPRGQAPVWDRGSARDMYEQCAMPATMYASPNLTATIEGVALFDLASGTVAAGYEDKTVDTESVVLTGNLELTPVVVQENGKRMRTDLGGSVYTVNSPEAPGTPTDWKAYASGAAGGALLLAVVLYSWPVLKWRAALLAAPLYARLKKDEVLENPLRDDILSLVQETPGISASELGRRVECGWGTLVYHLTVLERMQLVSSAREGRHKRFFAQGRINYSDKGAVGLLANPAARTILDAIRGAPGSIQKDLSERLNLSPGTVAWHVERLAAEGLVIKEDEGRTVRYYPSERLLQLTQRLAA